MQYLSVAVGLVGSLLLAGCQTQTGTLYHGPSRNNEVACLAGTATGAVVGGLVGSTIGGGRGTTLATAAGVGVGSVAGNRLSC
jgi:outer membrane lipoprotein SlyB